MSDDVLDLIENVAFHFVTVEVNNRFLCDLFSKLLIFQQLISNHEALIVSLFYRFLYLLIVCLDRKVHGFHFIIDPLIYLELVFSL